MEGSEAKKRPGMGSKTSSLRMKTEYRTRDGEQKECVVEERDPQVCKPMTNKKKILMMLGLYKRKGAKSDTERGLDGEPKKQYTLRFIDEKKSDFDSGRIIVKILNWCFIVSFSEFMMAASFTFYLICTLFCFLIAIGGALQPGCLIPDTTGEKNLMMASFHLSWTTFSTVGYGHAYPQVGESGRCAFLNILCSIESFIGVLFAGSVGAVLFGKVQTIYTKPMLKFSDFCCVKYGTGTHEDESDDEFEEDEPVEPELSESLTQGSFTKQSKGKRFTFPMVVFRIANELYDVKNGEIINLSVNGVAVVEVPGGKRNFPKMELEMEQLPLFRRVWYIRHEMNANSPLLKPEVRKRIKKAGGKWPTDLNTVAAIKDSLDFIQIMITLEGVSALSKSSVYDQKVYDISEMKIGWQFALMTYKDEGDNTELKVDLRLINDITKQEGVTDDPEFIEELEQTQ